MYYNSTWVAVSPFFNFKQQEDYTDFTSLYFFLISMTYLGCDAVSEYTEELYDNYKETRVEELSLTELYCYVATARLLKYKLPDKQREWIDKYLNSLACYDGGYGFYQHSECHGSSTFCAVAIITILDLKFDKDRTVRWLVNRQAEISFTVG